MNINDTDLVLHEIMITYFNFYYDKYYDIPLFLLMSIKIK